MAYFIIKLMILYVLLYYYEITSGLLQLRHSKVTLQSAKTVNILSEY